MIKPITWSRILWHINRSPMAHVIKSIRRIFFYDEINQRRKLIQQLPVNPILTRHTRQVLDEGYTIVSDIVEVGRLAALTRAAESKMVRANSEELHEITRNKNFWVRLLDEDMVNGTLAIDSPFVEMALQPEIVSIVSHAFGELPRLDYVLLTLSKSTNDELSYSQLWHRDHDDTRVIKFFVYLTDVQDSKDGPFTFIPASHSDKLGYRLRSHQTDEQIAKRIPPEAIVEMKAPCLSAFIVDTSRCLHMGSRLSYGHQRLLYTATFISAPRIYPEPPPRFRLCGSESDLLKLLLAQR